MRVTTINAVIAVVALATSGVTAFWRMECRSSSGLARIDPLISPGQVGEHAHSIFGTSGFSESAGYSELRGGDCTSCSVTEDHSAYWHPALYFKHASNGSFIGVPEAGGMLAYYLLYPNAGETNVTAFPAGFQMIAGDNERRNFTLPVPDPPKSSWPGDPSQSSQSALAQKAIGFNCLNYAIAPEGSLYRHFLPDKAYMDANCKDGVRFELMFPSCWNGKDVTSSNFKDHVAYPDLVMTGNCPSDYPVRLVSLFYEIIYNTQNFEGVDGEFVIANGDPTGYGYHGDFMMGWDEGFLQDAVNTCTNPSGEIGDCPLFTIQDPATYDQCKFPQPANLANVDIAGPLDALPGNVAIQAGPEPATHGNGQPSPAPTSPAATGPVVPTLSHSAGSTIPTGSTYMPGGIFIESSQTSLSSSTPSTTPPPPPPPPPPATTPLPPGQSILSTMYTTRGSEVLEVMIVEELVTVTAMVTATTTMMEPGKRKRSHVHKRHGHGGLHL